MNVNMKFSRERMQPGNPKWPSCAAREERLYQRSGNLRSEFYRDYTRILHCQAYRRLKHKTQVFFATENDHICTRIEHVNHVASVSYTIADDLGLNTELVSAIAIGHDLGHAPFGHQGEEILKDITKERLNEDFWHERNSLWFVDQIETLPDPNGEQRNLDLTYAVRDGIVCHCGEIDEGPIFPRSEAIDLYDITHAGRTSPYTWEACVVKISDKIAFLGRDIEDALELNILDVGETGPLANLLKRLDRRLKPREINNTVLMNEFISDLSRNSSPDEGIRLSEKYLEFLKAIREFNSEFIYNHPRLAPFKSYARLILVTLVDLLCSMRDGRKEKIIEALERNGRFFPLLAGSFGDWLIKYSDLDPKSREEKKFANDLLYRVEDKAGYEKAVLDYVSGMTDKFAIRCFNEITSFK